MNSLTYAPRSSTLILLFKLARARLMASSYNIALLTDERLVYVTEEINKISDVICEAGVQNARNHAARPAPASGSDDAVLPIVDSTAFAQLAAAADVRHAINNGKHLDKMRDRQ